jgi:hypothetical protein
MKLTRERLALLLCMVVFPYAGMTQCGTIRKITYDTTVTGGGSAYPGYDFSMPKFNPSLGTLTNVKLASVVTLSFTYTIENKAVYSATTKVRLERTDTIIGPTMNDTLQNDYYSVAQTSVLGAADGVPGSGPDFKSYPAFYILNNDTVLNRDFTNVAGYMGAGTIGFVYKTDLGSQTNGNFNVNINGSANDKIKFSVTYTYCDNIVLASEITSFSASKKTDYINVRWFTSNETVNHTYELQRSYDGTNFVAIATVPSNPGANQIGNYEYNYIPLSGETGKLYFRVKQIETGAPKYSPVRVVDQGASTKKKGDIKLFPNPTTGTFSVILSNNTVSSDWTIELFNLKGQLISRRQAMNSTLSKFVMNESLSPGVYFVLVTNKKNNQRFVERLIAN